jgi:hypothetical protein
MSSKSRITARLRYRAALFLHEITIVANTAAVLLNQLIM